jgi:hypothetical protein
MSVEEKGKGTGIAGMIDQIFRTCAIAILSTERQSALRAAVFAADGGIDG